MKRPVADMGSLLQFTVEALDAYAECAARHRALGEWAKK